MRSAQLPHYGKKYYNQKRQLGVVPLSLLITLCLLYSTAITKTAINLTAVPKTVIYLIAVMKTAINLTTVTKTAKK